MYDEKFNDAQKNEQDWLQERADAHQHAVKELGQYYEVAVKELGDVNRLDEVAHQEYKALKAKNVPLRDQSKHIIIGLYDLEKFKLNPAMIAERKKEANLLTDLRKAEEGYDSYAAAHGGEAAQKHVNTLRANYNEYKRLEDANLHAHKELGPFFLAAVDALGSYDKVLTKAREQLDVLEQNGVVLRRNGKTGEIVTGKLHLASFGLTPEQVSIQNERLTMLGTNKPVDRNLITADTEGKSFQERYASKTAQPVILGESRLNDGAVLG